MAKRKLNPEERARIAEERRSSEVMAHLDKMVSVRVEEETNEDGEPIVWVHYVGERQSKDWKRDDP